ncbi:MAG: hypothetical protein Q7S92_05945 [Candidatus Diapherotrites archaeon]|nr:hypothetical protein [Candidatus Diapherotrites archaeon]
MIRKPVPRRKPVRDFKKEPIIQPAVLEPKIIVPEKVQPRLRGGRRLASDQFHELKPRIQNSVTTKPGILRAEIKKEIERLTGEYIPNEVFGYTMAWLKRNNLVRETKESIPGRNGTFARYYWIGPRN